MISLEEAQTRIFALKDQVDVEQVPLIDAVGRWACEDVIAQRTQPARDLSAMDGYAVRLADGEGPWLDVGESGAGRAFSGLVESQQAVRIFTGAVVPHGADTVIIQEDILRSGDEVHLRGSVALRVGDNIRTAGGDFKAGTMVVEKGARLHARRIALAAMAGFSALAVRRTIRVAILSTGDELVSPGFPCADDQIPSSNDVMLAAMLAELPVEVTVLPMIGDDLGALTTQLAALTQFDIIVTTGGASVGDHDLIAPAIAAAGGTIDFWKIAMRPGKPVIAGRMHDAVVLGLPGNPVSAFVTAYLLLLPLIRHLSGDPSPLPQRLSAKLAVPLRANGPRTDHIRAVEQDGTISPVGVNDSAMLAALSASNALIIRDIDAAPAEVGSDVPYYRI
jgi:molybdopterin molybdotransferase